MKGKLLLALLLAGCTSEAGKHLAACRSNGKEIAYALEMYSTDNSGRYPPKMSLLTPKYLKSIPTCPAAGGDSYSKSYTIATFPDWYTFVCEGESHKDAGEHANYPQYHTVSGIPEVR